MDITLEFKSFVNHGYLTSALYVMRWSETSYSPLHIWLGRSEDVELLSDADKNDLAKRELQKRLNA